ncbi:uncharacterized protein MELLADRAFT_113158 [Melampsora larici-populina 98AG31]|uniref:Uncharacterized protein n=1 Tax=Melampsora larici-populina (strain 98AG31 / pathotype 3-4-7) TaxID=747676 RepID=F4S8Y0_MELLP|nr:uncharacterized protein MELLADRAFT_113158 [Melampsora larici-populina 98AG31]EGF98886.1 hypothetical protein MELLADRAFT_113158 [Melampsora larici-populina 98AG31]
MYARNCGVNLCLSGNGNFEDPAPHNSSYSGQLLAAQHLDSAREDLKLDMRKMTNLTRREPFIGDTNSDTVNLEYADMSNDRYRNKSGPVTHFKPSKPSPLSKNLLEEHGLSMVEEAMFLFMIDTACLSRCRICNGDSEPILAGTRHD